MFIADFWCQKTRFVDNSSCNSTCFVVNNIEEVWLNFASFCMHSCTFCVYKKTHKIYMNSGTFYRHVFLLQTLMYVFCVGVGLCVGWSKRPQWHKCQTDQSTENWGKSDSVGSQTSQSLSCNYPTICHQSESGSISLNKLGCLGEHLHVCVFWEVIHTKSYGKCPYLRDFFVWVAFFI